MVTCRRSARKEIRTQASIRYPVFARATLPLDSNPAKEVKYVKAGLIIGVPRLATRSNRPSLRLGMKLNRYWQMEIP